MKRLIDSGKISDMFFFKYIRLTSCFSVFFTKIIVFMVLKMILAKIATTIVTMPSRNGTAYFASTGRLVIIKEPCRSLLPLLFSHKNRFLINMSVIGSTCAIMLALNSTDVPN